MFSAWAKSSGVKEYSCEITLWKTELTYGIRATGDDSGNSRPRIILKSNYKVWATVMEQTLKRRKLWGHVMGTANVPPLPRTVIVAVAARVSAPGVDAMAGVTDVIIMIRSALMTLTRQSRMQIPFFFRLWSLAMWWQLSGSPDSHRPKRGGAPPPACVWMPFWRQFLTQKKLRYCLNDYQLIHILNLRIHIHINSFKFFAAHRQSFFHVKASQINKVEEESPF